MKDELGVIRLDSVRGQRKNWRLFDMPWDTPSITELVRKAQQNALDRSEVLLLSMPDSIEILKDRLAMHEWY